MLRGEVWPDVEGSQLLSFSVMQQDQTNNTAHQINQ